MEELHKTSSSTRLYDDEKLPPRKIPWPRRHPYRTLGAVAGTIAILGITLGVGLSVGLTNSGDAPTPTSTLVSNKRSDTPVATASQASSCYAGGVSVLGAVNLKTNTTPRIVETAKTHPDHVISLPPVIPEQSRLCSLHTHPCISCPSRLPGSLLTQLLYCNHITSHLAYDTSASHITPLNPHNPVLTSPQDYQGRLPIDDPFPPDLQYVSLTQPPRRKVYSQRAGERLQ
jgi:hypothetical protein